MLKKDQPSEVEIRLARFLKAMSKEVRRGN
jgi:hypothetical protein